jgi:hypothetical protein
VGRLRKHFVTLCVLIAAAAGPAASQAAVTLEPIGTDPIPSWGSWGDSTMAPDGTYWIVTANGNTGTVWHYDDDGNDLGDGFDITRNGFNPMSIAYYGGRVYLGMAAAPKLLSYRVDTGDGLVWNDADTGYRLGSLGAHLRIGPNGVGAVATGQANKIGLLDFGNVNADHPFYSQAFMGWGINDGNDSFQSCHLAPGPAGVGDPGNNCGQGHGLASGFGYPIDTAFSADGGIYVLEKDNNRVTHIINQPPGPRPGFSFGSGGSSAGQLDNPRSIVHRVDNADVYVSEEGNRRISVFTGGGAYLASFGWGVRDGSAEFQSCGVDIGQCQAGLPYQQEPRSYYTDLELGPDGTLRAYMPLVGQYQVFKMNTADGSPPPTDPDPDPEDPTPPAGPRERIRLGASPIRVREGRKTTLTASVKPKATCRDRHVLFQVRVGRTWDNVSKAVRPNKKCKAKKRRRIGNKAVFRAQLLSTEGAVLANSPNVTVKVKQRR